MPLCAEMTETKQPTFSTLLTVSLLALVAMAVSGYLSWLAILEGQSALGCGGGTFDCDEVLGSRWSVWLGMPVSVLGMLTYAAILFSTLALFFAQSGSLRDVARLTVTIASTTAVGAGLWVMALQVFAVQAFCPYCCAVHASGLSIVVLLVLTSKGHVGTSGKLFLPFADKAVRSTLVGVVLGALGLMALIGGQLLAPGKTHIVEQFAEAALQDTGVKADTDHTVAASNATVADGEPRAKQPANAEQSVSSPEESKTAADRSPVETSPGQTSPIQTSPVLTSPDDEWEDLFGSPSPSSKPDTASLSKAVNSSMTGRRLKLIGGRFILNLDEHMRLGASDAPHVIVELFDYTCQHCRRMHGHVKKARVRYGDQLAVVLLTIPMHSRCNPSVPSSPRRHQDACELARLADAVWWHRREKFAEFHDWLLEGPRPPAIDQVRRHVLELIGEERFAAAKTDRSYRARLLRCIVAYDQCRKGRIPKIIIADKVASGAILYPDDLYDLIESNLSIEPVAR